MGFSEEQITRAWSQLSEMERRVASRHLNRGMTLAEIAAESDRSPGTIRALWERARRKLMAAAS